MVTPFVPVEPFTNLGHLEFQCAINGTARQKGQSRLMIFPILNLLSSLAQLTTLMPGDLIFTGTPEGVGTLTKGDHITLSWIHPWKHQFEAVF